LRRQDDGVVSYDSDPCIGCRYCILACPWGVPTTDWDTRKPKIHKCTHCADRCEQPAPEARNARPLTSEESQKFLADIIAPACVKACPADALKFGSRDEMLAEAHKRMAARPGKYVDHIYGEHEAGGTNVLYLSAVPFAKLGFPDVGTKSFPGFTRFALHAVPPAVMAVGALLGGSFLFFKNRALAVAGARGAEVHEHHPEFAPIQRKVFTPFAFVLLFLMGLGALSFVVRFIRGLGGSTGLNDTYPWGLWIIFDLVWIALAAGAFATAGLIYVFQRKDLYTLGRSAVLMGLLSYTFVTVTLLADLGLPLHSYHLALQAPEQSAMFEVSWCVGLYVTILALEFLPVVLDRYGMKRAKEIWQQWSGFYVACAVAGFVYMLSRRIEFAALAFVIFGTMAWLFRPKDSHWQPIMLAIAAVTLSTMHQSSLGSLYLLMKEQLASQWWTPVLPISFFLSSIAAGTAVVVLVEMWIAKGWRRPLNVPQVAALGQVTFWALLVYLAFRIGDLASRGEFAQAFTGKFGTLFAIEMIAGGLVPLLLLSRKSLRIQPKLLFLGTFLVASGIVLNRVNVVILAMDLRGAMPGGSPGTYTASVVEWGLSIGLIAATIFLFGLGARLFPVLAKVEPKAEH
jgi:formate dehydrogenase iron-sulfur subunit